ncbi:hypothetical protein WH87_10600 [Devosia epidermidihirudinis]|uniref:HTH tetR-type domain-containing protein n=1 Tax=Devosia epidermidihirudinis TaxID=1293439 RepID=A0A0F5QBG7_9HYPH|nr:TetR/AcrR family transcriptional regulator [Devosia epidermidihirudinis]KKC38058.1 hypothetical protein WH87_10600 [Devosia epidermidihirudinis]
MQCDQPTFKRESGDERRLAIAAAARALIVEKGLEGLRTRDIAARVGINIATLHYHVPTKEALITLVAESMRDDFKRQALRRSRHGKTGLQQLRMEFEDFQESLTDTPELITVLTELIEKARRDAGISSIMAPMHDFWRYQFASIFRLGVDDGSFRTDVDPVAAALITTGALMSFGRIWTDFSVSYEQLTTELERSFILKSPS